MKISVIKAPLKLPVSVAEVKKHLRIEISDDDAEVEQKIKAVISALDPPDGRLGRAMITQTLRFSIPGHPANIIRTPYPSTREMAMLPRLSFWAFRGGVLRLPYPPVQSIVAVRYIDLNDEEKTIPPSAYYLRNDQEPAYLVLKSTAEWPSDFSWYDPYPFHVDFVCGWGDGPENVPEMVRLGIMMEVGDYYMQRENISLGQNIVQNEFTRHLFDNFIWRP